MGNLALMPMYKPLAELTELLRKNQDGDYLAIYKPVKEMRDKLLALAD